LCVNNTVLTLVYLLVLLYELFISAQSLIILRPILILHCNIVTVQQVETGLVKAEYF